MIRHNAMLLAIVFSLAILCLTESSSAEFLRIAAYNTFNNPDNVAEDVHFRNIFEAIGQENVNGLVKRLDVLAVSETDSGSSVRLANILDDLYGVSSYNVVTSSSNGFDRTAIVYDSSSVNLLGSTEVAGNLTQRILRAHLRPVGTSGTADFFVYAVHLKSGATDSDIAERAAEAALIRADGDALGSGANIIYAGDFNLGASSEAAWDNMLANGNGRSRDVADAPGEWRDNINFRDLHTWDSADGMSLRLDLQFASDELFDGEGLDYVDGSYRVFGNNGTHTLGAAIDTGSGATPTVLASLIAASDHLPVVADYVVPEPGSIIIISLIGMIFMWRRAGICANG